MLLFLPQPAFAWGFDVHKYVMDRAIALLPGQIRPLFERHRAVVTERAIDPDTWITVGGFDDESPRHFLNLDAPEYGAYPFRALPRDYAAAVARFGEARIRRNGTVPWRAEEFFRRLADAFATLGSRGAVGEGDVIRLSAALSHYVADAYVPFHAVSNYDGQQTGQRGIHARFETMLHARFARDLRIAPKPIAPVRGVRDMVFDALLEGTRLAPAILRADREAATTAGVYDDDYFRRLLEGTQPVLERRLSEATAAVAAAIAGAYEQGSGTPRPRPRRQ